MPHTRHSRRRSANRHPAGGHADPAAELPSAPPAVAARARPRSGDTPWASQPHDSTPTQPMTTNPARPRTRTTARQTPARPPPRTRGRTPRPDDPRHASPDTAHHKRSAAAGHAHADVRKLRVQPVGSGVVRFAWACIDRCLWMDSVRVFVSLRHHVKFTSGTRVDLGWVRMCAGVRANQLRSVCEWSIDRYCGPALLLGWTVGLRLPCFAALLRVLPWKLRG